MKKLQLFILLRRHIKLSEKRNLAYQQNKAAKFLIYFMGTFCILYLMFISVLLALIGNDSETFTPYEMFFGLLPFMLIVDFSLRFLTQQTPAQLIKPYSLLPIPKYTCVEMFVLSSVVTPNNLLWLFLTVPYAIMTILFSEGLMPAIGLVVAFQLIITVNSQWYMLTRSLITKSLKWWLLPVAVYGITFSPIAFDKIGLLLDTFAETGFGFVFWHPLNYLIVIFILVGFIELNKRLQYQFTYLESNGTESTKLKTVSTLHVFDRFGEIGEYVKLEVKSIMRNKNMRKSFIFATVVVVLLSIIISFTDVYSDGFYKIFWVAYPFVVYGSMSLIKIMSAEGNYIDCLMIHKENIIKLLKAKYYFYSIVQLLPLLLMLPTVFTGKYSLLALISMMIFTAGTIYFCLMQMAVYNRQTIPLNTKFISRGNVQTNYFQIVAELVAIFLPMTLISMLRVFLTEDITYTVLMLIGLGFILTNNLWIKNVYKRMMNRRYENMESFRATR